jgi:cytochrome c-type biogenesis protein
MGLAVPFMAAALMVERFITVFGMVRHLLVWVNRVAGVMLVLVGSLMVSNRFTMLSNWLQDFTPEFILNRI